MQSITILEQQQDWKIKYAKKATFTNVWVRISLLPIGFGVLIAGYALWHFSNFDSTTRYIALAIGIGLLFAGIISMKLSSKKAEAAIKPEIINAPICYVKLVTGNADNGFYNVIYTVGNKRHDATLLQNIHEAILNTLYNKGADGKDAKMVYDLFKEQTHLGDPSNLTPKLLPFSFTEGEEVYWRVIKLEIYTKELKEKFKTTLQQGYYYALYIKNILVPINEEDLQ